MRRFGTGMYALPVPHHALNRRWIGADRACGVDFAVYAGLHGKRHRKGGFRMVKRAVLGKIPRRRVSNISLSLFFHSGSSFVLPFG